MEELTRDSAIRADPSRLWQSVHALTSLPRARHYLNVESLGHAAQIIFAAFEAAGFKPVYQDFKAAGNRYRNVIASIGPQSAPLIVVGAHYDVAGEQPGADDNASGVAGLIEIARLLSRSPPSRYRIELVAFCLEEPPFFGSPEKGSSVHALSLKRAGVDVSFMMSLEMIGYFDTRPGSQSFPMPELRAIYPNRGDFIAVAGEPSSAALVTKVASLMRSASAVDVQSISAPRTVPGIGLSDHLSYWDAGFPALMVTDTAFFRNPHYHTRGDTIETLDFVRMGEVINGVVSVLLKF